MTYPQKYKVGQKVTIIDAKSMHKLKHDDNLHGGWGCDMDTYEGSTYIISGISTPGDEYPYFGYYLENEPDYVWDERLLFSTTPPTYLPEDLFSL